MNNFDHFRGISPKKNEVWTDFQPATFLPQPRTLLQVTDVRNVSVVEIKLSKDSGRRCGWKSLCCLKFHMDVIKNGVYRII